MNMLQTYVKTSLIAVGFSFLISSITEATEMHFDAETTETLDAQQLMNNGLAVNEPTKLTAATIRKIDLKQQKITLKHAAIASIKMPPMTMVFKVKDPQLLDGIAVDDQVFFAVEKHGSEFIVTALKKSM